MAVASRRMCVALRPYAFPFLQASPRSCLSPPLGFVSDSGENSARFALLQQMRGAARTRKMRREREEREEREARQPAVYGGEGAAPTHYGAQHTTGGDGQYPSFSQQMIYAVASGAGICIGFALLAKLFGWGPRVRTVHVDSEGRPVNPYTGQIF